MTPRQYSLRLLMVAALALCAGVWWWWDPQDPAVPPPSPGSSAPAADADSAPGPNADGTDATASAPLAAAPPMPAREAPLRDALPSLKARADAGDSLAACRLGVELLLCGSLENPFPDHDQDVALAGYEAQLAEAGHLEQANATALARITRAQLREACAGIAPDVVQQAHHYVRQAALAGEPEAMIRYAAGETLGGWGFSFIASPAFDQWRREAPQVLRRALEAGTPEAPLLWLLANRGEAGYLTMLLPRDDVQAGASLALARRLFGDDPAFVPFTPAEALAPEQQAQVEALAAQWHEDYYGNGTRVLAESSHAVASLRGRTAPALETPPFPGTPRPFACDADDEAAP